MPSSRWPTSVVVAHGAFHKASQFDEFGKHLAELGLKPVVPQLPSSSATPPSDAFEADVEVLRAALVTELSAGHDVILLAHSYGGIPGCEALEGLPEPCTPNVGRVLGIIFVSAFVAEEGQNLITAKKGGPAEWVKRVGALAYVNDAETTLFSSIEDIELRSSLAANMTAQALSSFVATVSYAGWQHYPTFYVRCEEDQAQPADEQDHFIGRLKGCKTYVGQAAFEGADHCPHASMPRGLALQVSMVKGLFEQAAEPEGAMVSNDT
ncbi:hypothetical protein LTR85_007828 [Meristemomyces frigidus]|nr:hypothetical protein LTR85_007828 [Meristemomyces frigidus]